MKKFFDLDNPVWVFLGRVGDLMILNVIFIITCLPVITVGAALSALYSMTLKMVCDEESYLVRSYLKAFRQNFRQATVVWIFTAFTGYVLYLYYSIVSSLESGYGTYLKIPVIAAAFLFLMYFEYVYPLIGRFQNTLKNILGLALMLAVRHMPTTVIVLLITVAPVVLTFRSTTIFSWAVLLWILFGFSVIAFLNSWFLRRVFDLYTPEDER